MGNGKDHIWIGQTQREQHERKNKDMVEKEDFIRKTAIKSTIKILKKRGRENEIPDYLDLIGTKGTSALKICNISQRFVDGGCYSNRCE